MPADPVVGTAVGACVRAVRFIKPERRPRRLAWILLHMTIITRITRSGLSGLSPINA
jgi:hypothetical protein